MVSSYAFGDATLGDEIPPINAIGFAVWVGLVGLASGSVAFALAPIVGRASAAGVAGVVLIGAYFINGYAPYFPAVDASRTSPGSTGRTTTSRSPASSTGRPSGSSCS